MINKDLKWFVKLTYFYCKMDKDFTLMFWKRSLFLEKIRLEHSIDASINYILEYEKELTIGRKYRVNGFYYNQYNCIDSILEKGLLNYYKEFKNEFNYF